jgi:hypothetical protein
MGNMIPLNMTTTLILSFAEILKRTPTPQGFIILGKKEEKRHSQNKKGDYAKRKAEKDTITVCNVGRDTRQTTGTRETASTPGNVEFGVCGDTVWATNGIGHLRMGK